MSDTPLTDNIARGNHVVPTEFAQDLERERNEARNCFKAAMETAETYKRERNDLQDQRDLSIRMAKERERERDEAQEALEHMKRERQNFHEAWKKFCNPFLEVAK